MYATNFFISSSAEEVLDGVTIYFEPNGFRLDGMKKNGKCSG
jgi:hypothetical protein